MSMRRAGQAVVAVATTVVLLTALLAVVAPGSAFAAGTILFQNNFNNRTVDGTGTVTTPAPPSGTNVACLTASGNSATLPLLSCSGTTDAQGAGKLRLTAATGNLIGGVFGATSFPTSNGLDVTFTSYQWGGGGADGMLFALAGVDPANPVPPTTIGPSGGSLGYTVGGSIKGMPYGYLGVGLDVYGNYSSSSFSGSGCTNPANFGVQASGTVAVRGPGNGLVGYCGLSTTYEGTTASKLVLRAATRAAAAVPVQVLINPTATAFTSETGVVAAAGTYKVVVTPVGGAAKTLSGPLPTVTSALYPASWLTSAGIPKQLAFAFVGSTGSVTDNHEISNVKVLTFNPVPQLAVSTTSYTAASPLPGAPVNYVASASVLTGADEPSAISVTQTTPAGVVPVGAYGTGWTCAAPVGRSVTCTTTASSFTNGTALPSITVVAIVTATGMTASTVQNASVTTVSSADANPATDSVMTAGTVSGSPTILSVSPAIGSIAGGGTVTVGLLNLATTPTAIEIGTTAEQQAGTPVTLLPCQGAATTNCFTVNALGLSLNIASMPARASAAAVTVTVVNLGAASAGNYVYADKPATMVAPTATAGITSTTVNWVAPADNGSAITGYVVNSYLNGALVGSVTTGTTATTRSFTGLTAGGSYTYTVSAINAYGTSTVSPPSVAVIPYQLPTAPTITAVTARDLSIGLTWSPPANNGGAAITSYIVTPYIGNTAQPTQTFAGSGTSQIVTGLTAGTAYTFTVAAVNAAGTGPPSARSVIGTPNAAPTLTFTDPPSGEVGAAYSRTLTVNFGTAPFVWSVSSGTLPAGLTLAAGTGVLSGTPTAAGSFPVTVQVTDASGLSATKSFTLVIAAAPVITFAPAAGEVSVAYSQQPALTGGTAPVSWAISAGSLPAGLTIDSATGLISGTPTASGTFRITVTATDSFAQTATSTVNIVIAALPTLVFAAPPAGQVGVAYSAPLSVTGGTAPFTYSIPAGNVPAGLTFNTSTGLLTGTPTTIGTSNFTVTVVDSFGKSASRTVTLVIAAGPLVIVKTANSSSTVAGGTVAYTIVVSNTGAADWTGVNVSDPLSGVLDDATYNSNAAATGGSVSYATGTLTWTGTVPANGSVTISYSVTVNNPDVGNKVLANTVTSSTLGTNCAGGSGDTRCTATVTVSGLSIVKTADVGTSTPGGVVNYTIVVTNNGQTPYAGATFTDSLAGALDDATYNADAGATTGSVAYSTPALTWTGDLAVGASATIKYSMTVANPDTGNRTLTGTIVSPTAGSTCPSGNPAAGCSVTVTILIPALNIVTTTDVATTTPGSIVSYTLTITNTGQTAYPAATVTLNLADVLDDSTFNGTPVVTGNGSAVLSGSTLTWTGALPLAATSKVTFAVTVRNPDPGGLTLVSVASSPAAGSTCPTGNTLSSCSTTVRVLIPALTISKSADVSSTTPNSVVHYTVTATNTGQTPYTGATFTDAMAGVPANAAYLGGATASSGSLTISGANLIWNGDLAIGATATINYAVTVSSSTSPGRVLAGSVTSTTAGNNCAAGTTDPRCTSSIPILIPGLSFAGSANSATTTPGGIVQYSVTLTNTGQTSYNGISVAIDPTGVFDDADYNYDAMVTTGNMVTNPDGTISWVLSLAPGATATGTMSLTVKDPDPGDRILNILVYSDVPGSTCPTGSTTPNCRTTVTVLLPGLTIVKSSDVATVTPGGTVNYSITATNTGQSAYPAANLSDSLAGVLTDSTYAADASATVGTVNYNAAAKTLSWTGPLAPSAAVTITYSVVVLNPDPGDKHMVNTVTSTSQGSNCAAGSTDARCTVTVNVLVPGLTIVKTAGVGQTTPGAVVGFTVKVTNSGATPYSGATFADALTGVLDDATYNNNASSGGVGTVSYAGSTLSWSGNLAVGASATVTYSVTVKAADVGDNKLDNTITSATVGNNCPTGGTDPQCRVIVPVARLILVNGATETTTTPGSVVHLTTTFSNTGQVPYTDITVVSPRADTSDDTIPTGDQVASSGSLVRTDDAVTWTGSIPVGGVVTITRTLTVKDPDPGNKIITSTLQSTAAGNNCPTGTADTRCTVTITVLVPGLTIAKSVNVTSAVGGDVVSYTITAQNTGQTPYTGATLTDSLTGVLDDAVYNSNGSATVGAVSYTAPTLSWTGNLAVGQTATITYSVTVRSPDPGDKTMVNKVTSTVVGSTCPTATGNAACKTTVVVLTPGLTFVKTTNTVSANLSTPVTFTITVTNTGQTTYPAAAFSDSLVDVLDDANFTYSTGHTVSSGTTNYASNVLTWSGSLAPGASATVTYTVTVKNTAPGDRSMFNTVVSSNVGSNCTSGSTDTRCKATVAVTNSTTFTVSKTADTTAAVPGEKVTYTVKMVNSGILNLAVGFTDPLAGVLDDATYNNDAVASLGSVSYTGSTLSWSSLALVPGTATVTYSVTVNAAITGDQILTNKLESAIALGSTNCLAASVDPACTSTVPVARLVIAQAYTETSTTPGSLVHLSATFTNTGKYRYQGITISSPSAGTVDDATPSGDQTATSGTLVLSATAITWTGDIPVGGSVTVTGTLTVNDPDTGNRVLTGTLVSTAPGNNCLAGSSDTRCTATLPVLLPQLTISKSADVTSVVPGEVAAYTVVIANTGQTPYVGAVVTDSLVGVLDDATYNSDATVNIGGLTYASSTLTWTGNLTVGQTATIRYTATALSPATGDKAMVNPVSSTTVGSTCPPASGNAACLSTVTVYTPALAISATADLLTANPGDTVNYQVVVTNTGQTAYAAAAFTAPLTGLTDDANYSGNATASSGAVILSGSTLNWSGPLGLGATATISYSVVIKNPVPSGSDHRLTQTVTSANQGSTCPAVGPNAGCVTDVPIASLQLSTVSNVTTTTPTGIIRYTNTFTNTGQVPYTGAVVLVDVVGASDDTSYNGDAAATSGSVDIVGDGTKISWTGDLPVGATVIFTTSVTVNNPDTGDKVVTSFLTSTARANNCPVGGSDPACRNSVTVLIPSLTLTTVANTTTTTPGSVVSYLVTITNSGPTAYTAAKVSDDLSGVLSDAVYSGGATASSGSLAYSAPRLTWTGNLAIGQTVTVAFSVTVKNPDPGDKVMVDRLVSDELGSSCPTGSAAAGCSSVVTVKIPALAISIAADRTTTVPGETVGYTLTIANTGQTDANSATVAIALAGVLDDATYTAGSATIGNTALLGSTVTWTGTLPAGSTAVVSYSVTVLDPDPGDRSLQTSVSSEVPGSTCTAAAPCLNTVTVLIPGLDVQTTASSGTATPGDPITYTITVTNNGETDYVATTLTSSLAGILDDATFDGIVNATSGVAAYTAPNLSWTGNLAVGATATISYTVVVRTPDPGDRTASATVVAPAAGSTCRAGSSNPSCTASVTILIPRLTISKSASSPTTTPGSVVGYTINVTNDGQTDYPAATITDNLAGLLSDATYNGDASVSGGGSLTYAAPTLSWTGNLPIGATAIISYSVTVQDPDLGDKQMTNEVTSTSPGSTCPVGNTVPACSVVVTVLIPRLVLTKTADTVTTAAGNAVQYTVTVRNAGETVYAPATFTDQLTDVLDDAGPPTNITASAGTAQYATGTLSWSGPLAIDATAIISYSVTTTFPASGNRTMSNTVLSNSPGSTCRTAADAGCTSTVGILVPALTISKSADATAVVAGGTVRYTITAANVGQSDYPQVEIADPLVDVLDDGTYGGSAAATAGSLNYSGGVLRWTGPLARSETVVISYSIAVNNPGTGDGSMKNRVTTAAVGSNCPVAGSDPACATSTRVDAQTISLTGLTPSFTLTGPPDSTVSANGVAIMTVITNSAGGYTVSVQGTASSLTGTGGNLETIPIENLSVRRSGTTVFQPLSATNSVTVRTRTGPSQPGGDAVSNDYRVVIPYVAGDTYSQTLDYIATTQ